MSLVRTYWNDFKVGDIIYVKGNDTPLTIKNKVVINEHDGIMGFTIDLEVKPSSPYSVIIPGALDAINVYRNVLKSCRLDQEPPSEVLNFGTCR